nr:uncharacterized protein LOC113689155 isoform X2 [Coffea arabica]
MRWWQRGFFPFGATALFPSPDHRRHSLHFTDNSLHPTISHALQLIFSFPTPTGEVYGRRKPQMLQNFGASPDDDCQEDRLSALSDSVLCHILSFVPTKLAASTSILSTRWRYIFFGVPKLDLDDSLLIHPQTQDGSNTRWRYRWKGCPQGSKIAMLAKS